MSSRLYLPGLSRLELPPVQSLKVVLRLLRPVHFPALHGGVLHGFLCRFCGHPLPPGLIPFASESGRTQYQVGDLYSFVLTATGEARATLAAVPEALGKLAGLLPLRADGPPAKLDGNFEVAKIEELEAPTVAGIEARAEPLAKAGKAKLRLLSPLRLKLPAPAGTPPRAYAGAETFPPALFFDRLLRRYFLLRDGEFPPARMLPPPAAAELASANLSWVDLPMRGPKEGRSGRATGTTLGGVVGELELGQMSSEAALLLAALEPFHAGSSIHYGFGRYEVVE